MNIQRTIGKAALPKSLTRPQVEAWEVGETTFQDTTELLESSDDLAGKTGTFSYQEYTPEDRGSISHRLGDSLKFGAAGAGMGAFTGFALAGFSEVVSNPLMSGNSAFSGMGTAIKIGATIGGGLGLFAGFFPQPKGGAIEGIFSNKSGKLHFHPSERLGRSIDLTTFAEAEIPEADAKGKRDYGDQWWNYNSSVVMNNANI